MEKYVVSLEIAKQLKESEWDMYVQNYWYKQSRKGSKYEYALFNVKRTELDLPAPIAEELLENIPTEIEEEDDFYYLEITGQGKGWYIRHENYEGITLKDADGYSIEVNTDVWNLSNTLAVLWLKLKQSNLLNK